MVPFPGSGEYVRLFLRSRFGATYYVEAAIPYRGEPVDLDMEPPIPCELSLTVKRDEAVAYSQRIAEMYRTGRVGFSHTDLYTVGEHFKLGPGDYSVIFEGSDRCVPPRERGGTITLEEEFSGDPTTHVLLLQARHALALALSIGGSLILILLEIWPRASVRRREP